MHEARSQLSKRVDEVQSGEAVVIAKAAKPAARPVPYEACKIPRKPGRWAGRIWIADAVAETPLEVTDACEGRE